MHFLYTQDRRKPKECVIRNKKGLVERALVAFKPRPILFIMNKICLNQERVGENWVREGRGRVPYGLSVVSSLMK